MDTEKIHKAQELGLFAEDKAAEEYIKKGCAILERRWHLGKTEIDLIVQEGNTVVFVEVKARSGAHESPLESVTVDKKRRMIRAADYYIRRLKGDWDYRFDLVALTGNKEKYSLEILEDAFLSVDFL